MRTIPGLAVTAIVLFVPVGLALAQTAPDPGAPAAPAATTAPTPPPAPAAPAAPAAPTPPANATAPAAQSAAPPSATPPASTAPSTAPAAAESTPKVKKKKTIGTARRQEIERSIDSGTVPSRYRRSVPKEYQQYIPFSKD